MSFKETKSTRLLNKNLFFHGSSGRLFCFFFKNNRGFLFQNAAVDTYDPLLSYIYLTYSNALSVNVMMRKTANER